MMWVRPHSSLTHEFVPIRWISREENINVFVWLCRWCSEEKGRLAKCSGAYLHKQSSVCWAPGIPKEQWTGQSHEEKKGRRSQAPSSRKMLSVKFHPKAPKEKTSASLLKWSFLCNKQNQKKTSVKNIFTHITDKHLIVLIYKELI